MEFIRFTFFCVFILFRLTFLFLQENQIYIYFFLEILKNDFCVYMRDDGLVRHLQFVFVVHLFKALYNSADRQKSFSCSMTKIKSLRLTLLIFGLKTDLVLVIEVLPVGSSIFLFFL